jgi:dextranase
VRLRPAQAFFHPGEPIHLHIQFEQPVQTQVTAEIYHLGEHIATWEAPCDGTHVTLQGEAPPLTPRGYLVHIRVGDEDAFTAFDVLDRWTQAPRYGYLYDFRPDRSQQDIDATLDYLLNLHVNGLQFYDWQYRHDTLLPPQNEFVDPLGRSLSLKTIRALMNGAHQRRMAAMPYTAIYAASPPFAAAHLDWQLYDAQGHPVDFADGFLKLMNMSSGWQSHFVRECQRVLEALPFDGIHVDQYGEPKTGFDSRGKPVDIPAGFAATLAAIHAAIPPDKSLVFNLVHNFPAETLANSPLDFWYSELWSPDTDLSRLWRTIRDNRRLNHRPAVLAVYIPPEREETVIAEHSTTLAAGGTHIAHGDHGRYLSDPYFPKAEMPSPALAARLQQLADFAVAYEDLLLFGEDVTEEWRDHIRIDGEKFPSGRVIVQRAGNRLCVNLLQATGHWDEALPPLEARRHVRLTLPVRGMKRRWWASPDSPPPHDLPADGTLPVLKDWLLVCLEFAESPSSPY